MSLEIWAFFFFFFLSVSIEIYQFDLFLEEPPFSFPNLFIFFLPPFPVLLWFLLALLPEFVVVITREKQGKSGLSHLVWVRGKTNKQTKSSSHFKDKCTEFGMLNNVSSCLVPPVVTSIPAVTTHIQYSQPAFAKLPRKGAGQLQTAGIPAKTLVWTTSHKTVISHRWALTAPVVSKKLPFLKTHRGRPLSMQLIIFIRSENSAFISILFTKCKGG